MESMESWESWAYPTFHTYHPRMEVYVYGAYPQELLELHAQLQYRGFIF
jgi:hypothetical protein